VRASQLAQRVLGAVKNILVKRILRETFSEKRMRCRCDAITPHSVWF